MAEPLSWPESILEFVTLLLKMTFYWLEAMLKCLVPSSYLRKDVKGQRVLITGAGNVMLTTGRQ